MIGDKIEWSFVRRQSTESFFLVFGDDYLQLPFPCYEDNLVCGFVPNNDCQK